MGVNVSSSFLGIAERFLHCRVGSIPFTYLGLQVGVQPRREGIWLPLLDLISRRLGVWSNRYIILGGRVVAKKFFVGGVRWVNKIAWVSWSNVCRPKSEGGLGVRDLGSWGSLERYCLCQVPLKDQFPRLFQVSIDHDVHAGSFGKWDGGVWLWEFQWRRHLFSWERDLLRGLLVLLDSIRVLASLWKSWAPLKVVVFSWQLLQDGIPSHQNFLRRRVLATPESAICALCGCEYVSSRDLLGHFEAFVG
ncbi:cysteine-rich receptor-like protein kinase, partial [Trifolium pratense]